MTGSRLKAAAFAAVAATSAIGGSTAGAATFNCCYEVLDASSGQSLDTFARIVVHRVGRLAPAQSVHQVHGRMSSLDDVPEAVVVDMNMVTGTTVVVEGEGAQMALIRNFGRGLEDSPPGAVILDCHADQARPAPREWVCEGMAVLRNAGSPVAKARELRLRRVKPAENPGCDAFDLRDD